MAIFPLELVRGNPWFLGCLPQKQDEKIAMCESWCYSHHNTVDSTLVQAAFVTKKFRRSNTPYPWILGVTVWSAGQKSWFFYLRLGSLGRCVTPNILGAASYRVTWQGRKNLGDGGTFPASVGAQKHLKRKIGGFQNDPQMSFWQIGCTECVGARQKYDQKKLQTMEMIFDTLIVSWRQEFVDLQKLGMWRFFFRAR